VLLPIIRLNSALLAIFPTLFPGKTRHVQYLPVSRKLSSAAPAVRQRNTPPNRTTTRQALIPSLAITSVPPTAEPAPDCTRRARLKARREYGPVIHSQAVNQMRRDSVIQCGTQLCQAIGKPFAERLPLRRIVAMQRSVGQVFAMAGQNGEIGS
jgi:hypothetical protein